MSLTSAERTANYRSRQRALGLPDSSRRFAKDHKRVYRRVKSLETRHFVGCDGEGCGMDEKGRQQYLLFRMGERELYNGSSLHTKELLDFICDHPRNDILVGFAFGYDVTMILRDLPEKQARRLFEEKETGEGHSRYVWYKNFDIEYLPKQYFRVRRVKIERGLDGRERRIGIPGSCRTIYETFGFFQKSFVWCLENFKIGTEAERKAIAEDKERRDSFTEIGQRERDYCAKECEFLSQLMEQFRENCYAGGIVPKSWNGAGKLAKALHIKNATPTRHETSLWVPKEVSDLAQMAYYGGRFEITRVGLIKGQVYEYDLRSAYPDAMRKLPCLCHGKWEPVSGKELKRMEGSLYIAAISFKLRSELRSIQSLGSLPIRSKEGHLYWPAQGSGVYWSPEIESAKRLGFNISYKSGWVYHKKCDCKVFDWVEELYNYRRSIGPSGPGYPIKLGINALYGQLAARVGACTFNNMVWAGLITAYTRTKLNDAIRKAPSSILMLATDAVYSVEPLDLDVGDNLGQWEHKIFDGIFLVQPGLYWCPNNYKRKDGTKKSRGLSGKFFEKPELLEEFERSWKSYEGENNVGLANGFPKVSVPITNFIGLKLALARRKPDLAGTWVKDHREISFDYRNKRHTHAWRDGHIVTTMKPGYPGLVSLPHRDFLANGGHEPWEAVRMEMDEQPDYMDFGPPFVD